MKKKLLLLLMLLLVITPVVWGRQPEAKDKCGDWIGPYPAGGGVYYRYVQSYIGEEQWASDLDCYQFKNENGYKVSITWYTTTPGPDKAIINGPYERTLDAKITGDLTALAPGERLKSIAVKQAASTGADRDRRRRN